MKKIIIGLFCISGLALAASNQAPSQHVSYFERMALRTQSPAVPTPKGRKQHYKDSRYIVTKNKTTIVAMTPYGK